MWMFCSILSLLTLCCADNKDVKVTDAVEKEAKTGYGQYQEPIANHGYYGNHGNKAQSPATYAYSAYVQQPSGYTAPKPASYGNSQWSPPPAAYSDPNQQAHGYSAPKPTSYGYGVLNQPPPAYSALSTHGRGYNKRHSAVQPYIKNPKHRSSSVQNYIAPKPHAYGYSKSDSVLHGYSAPSPHSYSAPATAVRTYSAADPHAQGYTDPHAKGHSYTDPNPHAQWYSDPPANVHSYNAPDPHAQWYNDPHANVHGHTAINPHAQGYSDPHAGTHSYSVVDPHAQGYSDPHANVHGHTALDPHAQGYSDPHASIHSYTAPDPYINSYSGSATAVQSYIAGSPTAYDSSILSPHGVSHYVPIAVKKNTKKKKIIAVYKGFYIPGGTQLFGKFKTLKDCEKACAQTPTCFAGDYNPWFKKCYSHSNYTACAPLRAHKLLVHFKKIPCAVPEAPQGRVMLGVQIHLGLEIPAKNLIDCLKKCAIAGKGIQARAININLQLCFGIDYDFSNHKCYFHVNNNVPPFHFCPANGLMPGVPRDAVPNPTVVSILLCPGP